MPYRKISVTVSAVNTIEDIPDGRLKGRLFRAPSVKGERIWVLTGIVYILPSDRNSSQKGFAPRDFCTETVTV